MEDIGAPCRDWRSVELSWSNQLNYVVSIWRRRATGKSKHSIRLRSVKCLLERFLGML